MGVKERKDGVTLRNRLTAAEKSKLRRQAESLVSKGSIVAICAYGSRVAGYARKDSDHNIIIVAKDFKDGVKSAESQEPFRHQRSL